VLVATWLRDAARARHAPALPWAGSLTRSKRRRRGQSGPASGAAQAPHSPEARHGPCGIHWNRRAAGLALAHSLPPRCERPSTGPRRARTGRAARVSRRQGLAPALVVKRQRREADHSRLSPRDLAEPAVRHFPGRARVWPASDRRPATRPGPGGTNEHTVVPAAALHGSPAYRRDWDCAYDVSRASPYLWRSPGYRECPLCRSFGG
jgi:hypothetical protein